MLFMGLLIRMLSWKEIEWKAPEDSASHGMRKETVGEHVPWLKDPWIKSVMLWLLITRRLTDTMLFGESVQLSKTNTWACGWTSCLSCVSHYFLLVVCRMRVYLFCKISSNYLHTIIGYFWKLVWKERWFNYPTCNGYFSSKLKGTF